jgi:hypothetical protein
MGMARRRVLGGPGTHQISHRGHKDRRRCKLQSMPERRWLTF